MQDNKCLLATACDADKKLLNITKADGTIIASAKVKIVWLPKNVPALFLEPTYTPEKSALPTFKKIFDGWACRKAAAMGGITVFRGKESGGTKVTVRKSRNDYQYEDGATGNENNAGLGVQKGEYMMDAQIVLCA